MKPQTKTIAKQVITLCWVVFVVGCGSLGSSSPSSSTNGTSTSAPTSNPVSVSNTAGSPKDMAVGDVYQLAFSGEQSTKIDMAGVPSDAEYVLAVANLNTSGSTASVQLASDESEVMNASFSAATEEVEEDHAALSDVAARFHEELRFHESIQASESAPLTRVGAGKAMSASTAESAALPAEGDQARFQVLSSLSGGSKVTISATATYVGRNVVCYLDLEVARRNPDDLTSDDVKKLCGDFDARMPQERQLFGAESDVDGNGRLNVLMTAQVNKMGAALGGLITGFFYASDLYDPGMEIIHTLVPDSKGIYGQTIPKDFTMENLLPSVLVHEFQHAINYNQHVLVRGGQPEEPIINEGLSHLSEDLLGVGRENYARYQTFLSRPSSYGLFSGGSPNLGARGASYLFLHYLLEQSDRGDFVTQLLNTTERGAANVEDAFGGSDASFDQFGEFYLRWVATLALGGEGISTDPRYSYAPRTRNATTGEWEGVCLKCDADDGRGTILSGATMASYTGYTAASLQPGAVQFYRVSDIPAEILLYGRGAGSFGAVLVRVR